MDKDKYLTGVYDNLSKDGFEIRSEKIDNLDVFIATKKQFKLSLLATQINIFAIVGYVDRISQNMLNSFSKKSIGYAIKNNQGLRRGLQSGVASFSLLVSSNIDEDAKDFVKRIPKKHFAAFEFPVLFDLENNQIIYCEKTPVFGAIYYKFLRNFVKNYFIYNRFCPDCGRQIPFDANVCPYCAKNFMEIEK